MKKITAILTLLAVMVTAFTFSLPVGAENADYEVRDGEIIEYTGTDVNVVIPSEIDGVTITGIRRNAFEGNSDIVSVTMSSTITTIGKRAFQGCEKLNSVNLANVTAIGENAFDGCVSLESISLDKVTEMGVLAFRGCGELSDIGSLNENLAELNSAFRECHKLKSVTVKGLNTDIEDAFEIGEEFEIHGYIGSKAEKYAHLNKIPFYDIETDDLVVKEWVVNDEGKLIYYNGTDTDIIIPATVDDITVTAISNSAFKGNIKITSVTIPEGITSMDDSAFYGCTSLKTASIPSSMTALPLEAFALCTSLERVDIPPEVTEFDANIFMDCTKVKIYGETGSEAEKYAADNNITFVPTGVYDDTAYNVTLNLARNFIFPEEGIAVTVYSGIYHKLSGGMPAWWTHDDDSYPSYILAWETPEASAWHKRYAETDITESKQITFTRFDQTINIRLKNPDNMLGCAGYIVNGEDYIGTGGIVLGKTKTAAAIEINCSPKTEISGTITIPVSEADTNIIVCAEGNKEIVKDDYGYYNSQNEFVDKTTVTIAAGETTANYSLDVIAGMDYTVTAKEEDGKYIQQTKEIKQTEQGKVTLDFDSFVEPNVLHLTVQISDNIKELKLTSGEAVTDLTGTVFIQNADEPYELIDSADIQFQNGVLSAPQTQLRNLTNASNVIISYVLWYNGNGTLCRLYDEGSYLENGKSVKDAGKAAKIQVKNQPVTLTLAESLPLEVSVNEENSNVLDITSKTDTDKNADIYTAYYDENGLLMSIERDNVSIGAGKAIQKTLTLNKTAFSSAKKVCVYLWDSYEPLGNTINLK